MEHTTVKYIIRSLVIQETKWNTLLNKIASLVNVPGQHGIVQADGRLDVWSRRQVVKCAVLLHWSCCSCRTASSYSNTRSSGDNSSSGISRGRRRGAAVAATSAGIDGLSGSCSYGISRRCCYTRIHSSKARETLAAAGGYCGRGVREDGGCGRRCGNSNFRRTSLIV